MKKAWIGIIGMVLVAVFVLLLSPSKPTSQNSNGIKITEVEFDGKIIEIYENSDPAYLYVQGWMKQELYYPLTSKDFKSKLYFELTGEIQLMSKDKPIKPVQQFEWQGRTVSIYELEVDQEYYGINTVRNKTDVYRYSKPVNDNFSATLIDCEEVKIQEYLSSMKRIERAEMDWRTQEYLAEICYPTYYLEPGNYMLQQAYRRYISSCEGQICVIESISYITDLGETEYYECTFEQLESLRQMLQEAKPMEFKEE